MNRPTSKAPLGHLARARTLTAGIALAIGATLLAPATAALAVPVATCPAANLTETQLNHLIVDLNDATVAKAVTGFQKTRTDGGGRYRDVQTWDVAHRRLDQTWTPDGVSIDRGRSLANGFDYSFASTSQVGVGPALAVLGRSSVWINMGEVGAEPQDRITRPYRMAYVRGNGTCDDEGAGLTITFDEDDPDLGYVGSARRTVVTDSTLAVTLASTTVEGEVEDRTALAYGRFDVADIPADQRISLSSWLKAFDSADQRSHLTSYAKKVAASAKAAAERAKRPVRATDVKAVKLAPEPGTKRSLVKTGIMVTATDPYTRKTLRITVTVAQQTLRIGDNW